MTFPRSLRNAQEVSGGPEGRPGEPRLLPRGVPGGGAPQGEGGGPGKPGVERPGLAGRGQRRHGHGPVQHLQARQQQHQHQEHFEAGLPGPPSDPPQRLRPRLTGTTGTNFRPLHTEQPSEDYSIIYILFFILRTYETKFAYPSCNYRNIVHCIYVFK